MSLPSQQLGSKKGSAIKVKLEAPDTDTSSNAGQVEILNGSPQGFASFVLMTVTYYSYVNAGT